MNFMRLCVKGTWCVFVSVCVFNVTLCVWLWPTCGHRSAVLLEDPVGPPLSGMRIVQLTLRKATEQPCFLQAASHWSFIGSDHERPSNEEQDAEGVRAWGQEEWQQKEGRVLRWETHATVTLVYTRSNYVVRSFRVWWGFSYGNYSASIWKYYSYFATPFTQKHTFPKVMDGRKCSYWPGLF